MDKLLEALVNSDEGIILIGQKEDHIIKAQMKLAELADPRITLRTTGHKSKTMFEKLGEKFTSRNCIQYDLQAQKEFLERHSDMLCSKRDTSLVLVPLFKPEDDFALLLQSRMCTSDTTIVGVIGDEIDWTMIRLINNYEDNSGLKREAAMKVFTDTFRFVARVDGDGDIITIHKNKIKASDSND